MQRHNIMVTIITSDDNVFEPTEPISPQTTVTINNNFNKIVIYNALFQSEWL